MDSPAPWRLGSLLTSFINISVNDDVNERQHSSWEKSKKILSLKVGAEQGTPSSELLPFVLYPRPQGDRPLASRGGCHSKGMALPAPL